MKIRALGNINSGQYNKGDEFEMADDEALSLIKAGAAEQVVEQSTPVQETAPVEAQPQVVEPTPAPVEVSDMPAAPLEVQPDPVELQQAFEDTGAVQAPESLPESNEPKHIDIQLN